MSIPIGYVGLRVRRATFVAALHSEPDRSIRTEIINPPSGTRWSWGDDAPTSHVTAAVILRHALGDIPLVHDLAACFVAEFCENWEDAWSLSTRAIQAWSEERLIYELSPLDPDA